MFSCWAIPKSVVTSAVLIVGSSLGGCANSEITGPVPGISGTTTLNAAQAWQYFSLADGTPVAVETAASASTAWDLGMFATSVALNGGAAGPGGVTGHCICQNASAAP